MLTRLILMTGVVLLLGGCPMTSSPSAGSSSSGSPAVGGGSSGSGSSTDSNGSSSGGQPQAGPFPNRLASGTFAGQLECVSELTEVGVEVAGTLENRATRSFRMTFDANGMPVTPDGRTIEIGTELESTSVDGQIGAAQVTAVTRRSDGGVEITFVLTVQFLTPTGAVLLDGEATEVYQVRDDGGLDLTTRLNATGAIGQNVATLSQSCGGALTP